MRKTLTILVTAMLLSACVTSGPTGKVSPPDPKEAARLNLDLGINISGL